MWGKGQIDGLVPQSLLPFSTPHLPPSLLYRARFPLPACSSALLTARSSALIASLSPLTLPQVDRTQDPPVRMQAQQAAPAIFHAMFSQVRGGGAGAVKGGPVGADDG